MDEATLQGLTDFLWPHGASLKGEQVYWLLDGARDPEIAKLLRFGGLDYTCLFTGTLHPRLQAAAPYLVQLSPRSPTTDRLLRSGWRKAWGILTVAPPEITLTQQRLHFKKLLRVRTEDGRVLVFRFYDPRVLNIYLPTCTAEERAAFFGPLTRLVAETGERGTVRVFEHGDGPGWRDVAFARRQGHENADHQV